MAGRIAYYGNISPQGLVLNLDAAIVGSYPKTGSTWFDISNNGNNGTLTNGPTFTGSDYGAIVFDGTNDYVNLNTSLGSGDFLIDMWVKKPNSGSNSQSLIGSYVDIASPGVMIWTTTTNTTFRISAGLGSVAQITLGSIADNTWKNIVINGTRTGNAVGYINGAPVNQVDISSQPCGVTLSTVGNIPIMGYLSGSVAAVKGYRQALTQFQVWQNFNAYKSRYGIPDIVTDGLVLNLDAGNPYSYLSGSSGTTWSNTVAVSSSISGTLTNGSVYSNGTITFDGSNDYVDCGNNTLTNITSPNITLAAIFSSTNINTTQTIMSKAEGGGYGLELNVTEPSLEVSIHIDGSYRIVTYASSNLQSNSTYYVVGTYDNNQIKLYVNGIQVNALTISGNITSTSVPMCLGTNPATGGGGIRYLTGKIYTAQIYNRALSQTEITQNFNALRGRYGI